VTSAPLIAPAPAKINLALVVGPPRPDGKHELVTVFQRVDLGDRIRVEPARETRISGFPEDTIVRDALLLLDARQGWHVHIDKQIPLGAGLGGGSSDAATALRLANEQLPQPLASERLIDLAAAVGADVPFFLRDGPQVGTGDGSTLEPVDLPQDFAVLLLLPAGARKGSTAEVYADFDRRGGGDGFDERAATLRSALAAVRRPRDLGTLPANDLACSPLAAELRAHGAFRADVSGAGPMLYGLFHRVADARRAARALGHLGRIWITVPAWYG
jgi:4-diphosphocytidyl-2-C-methyl-D-erythritol kinase